MGAFAHGQAPPQGIFPALCRIDTRHNAGNLELLFGRSLAAQKSKRSLLKRYAFSFYILAFPIKNNAGFLSNLKPVPCHSLTSEVLIYSAGPVKRSEEHT